MDEKRDTERLLRANPIRVTAYGEGEKSFSEETFTVEINRTGVRTALTHRITSGDTIGIVNLDIMREADFRFVGPSRVDTGGLADRGVVCLDESVGFTAPGTPFPHPELEN